MANKNHFIVMRAALLIAGLCIVVLSMLLLSPEIARDQNVVVFTASDVVLLFCVLVGPMLSGESIEEFTAGRIVSTGILFRATIPFAVCTAALVTYANIVPNPPLKLLVVAQLALTFVFVLWMYFGMLTSAHVEGVAQSEQALKYSVEALRASSQNLAVDSSRVDFSQYPRLESLSESIVKIAEEARYLTPVASTEAANLEQQIGSCLASLNAWYAVGDFTVPRIQEAEKLAYETLTLIYKRKSLRN